MTQQSKNQPAQTPTPDPIPEVDSQATPAEQVTPEPSKTDHLAALAAAGSFVERRIARGQVSSGEREASDEIMARIDDLLEQ